MEYRSLGRTGKKISLLSFGGMRLPRISVKASVEVIKKAYSLGINYFETAPGYGDSEHKIGIALKELDRKKIFISTKSHPGSDKTPAELRKRLEESLKKLQTNYIDFYQVWGLNNEEHYETVFNKNGTLKELHKALDERLIHHIGFTTHADPSLILKVMETKEFDSVTFIYHILNRKNEIVLSKAEELNMGIIIITPLSNGLLAHPTTNMSSDFSPFDVRDYSLKWLANDNRVTTITSGMKTLNELETNFKSINTFIPFTKTTADIGNNIYNKLKKRVGASYCTECNKCLPCPVNINIPELMRLNNLILGYNAEYYCKDRYKFMGNGGSWYKGVKANHCNGCGDCEPKCPDNLSIVSIIKNLHNILYTGDREQLSTH
ncbi:MAG: aldo/keto reductase [Spirochaetota bacterium]|nr:aldo/keto reductase [Spirochaetota bacterium]